MGLREKGSVLPKSFTPRPSRSDPLRESLVERARKRSVHPKSDPNWWVVSGRASLGDAYDSYDVHVRDEGFWCSCEGSAGGEYRKTCSHKTAVILWRQTHDDPWETDHPEPNLSENPQPSQGPDDPEPFSQDPDSGLWDPPGPENGGDEESSDATTATERPLTRTLAFSPVPDVEEEILEPENGPPGIGPEHPFDDKPYPKTQPETPDFDPYELDWDNPPNPQAIAGPKDTPLPDKFQEYRVPQWRGIIEVVEALDNPETKAVFVSAPTGAGKSLIGATVPQILNTRYLYLCTTLTLQDQIEREFHYAKLIKGRRNYPTLDEPDNPDLTAEDCTMEKIKVPACASCPGYQGGMGAYIGDKETARHCYHCHPTDACPYRIAKEVAAHARMAVLNTAYFLAETNHAQEGSRFAGRELVVIDEADTLEEQLMGFITVEITHRMRKRLGIGSPKRKTVADSWVEWVEETAIPACDRWLKANPPAVDLFGKPDPKARRIRGQVVNLRKRLRGLLEPPPIRDLEDEDRETLPDLAEGWVMEGGFSDKDAPNQSTITFKPITVREYAREVLWDKGGQFVLMSATIISPEQMAYDLGLEDGEWVVVELPSSFPKERRPVVVRSQVGINHKNKKESHPVITRQVAEIVDSYPDYRILVHSNSYHLTKDIFFDGRRIAREGDRRFITYLSPQEREKAITKYLETDNGVLVAPSLDRGIDLPDDLARVIVVAKVPYASLGDKQVSARLYGTGKWGKSWYATNTIRTIVQMTGRGMRHKDDWTLGFILDRQFVKLFYENQKLFPKWWREAVVFDENDPRWRDILTGIGE